jgi:hypothetical protein
MINIIIGVLWALGYMTLGIGFARTQPEFKFFAVVAWPVCLLIMALMGEIGL